MARFTALWCLLLLGCPGVKTQAPSLKGVEPQVALSSVETVVVLHGSDFAVLVRPSLSGGPTRVDSSWRAFVGTVEMKGVTRLDSSTLSGTVPAGLAPGPYQVSVQGPTGSASLSSAFAVVDLAVRTRLEAPATVTAGHAFTVSYVVLNSSSSSLAVNPRISVDGLEVVGSPTPTTVQPSSSERFSWKLSAPSPGRGVVDASAMATEGASGLTLELGHETATLLSQTAPSLVGHLLAASNALFVGDSLDLTLLVTNSGQASVKALAPSELVQTGAGALLIQQLPPPQDIPGTASRSFTWRAVAVARGKLTLSAAASGSDGNDGSPVLLGAVASSELTINGGGTLTATLSAPASANLGQEIEARLSVQNTTVPSEAVSGVEGVFSSGEVTVVSGPRPPTLELATGASADIAWTVRVPATEGRVLLSALATGTGTLSRLTAASSLVETSVTVVQPAALVAGFEAPTLAPPGHDVTIALRVENRGGGGALGVVPNAFAVTGAASVVAGPVPASADLPAGGTVRFEYLLHSAATGAAALTASARGTDANDGSTRVSPTAQAAITVGESQQLAADPFGDGTSFAFVFEHSGRVWLGPSKTGGGAVSMLPDGSDAVSVPFSLPADVVGSRTGNTSAPPYPSLGRAGCATNTSECGPDNEDGRGLFTSGSAFGSEWLVGGGARQGLQYVYLSPDQGPSTLQFRYLDLGGLLTGLTQTLSAMVVSGGRVYLGIADGGGNKPYLLALNTAPASPGLDPTAAEVVSLDSGRMPGVGRCTTSNNPCLVDTLIDFGGRLYLTNSGGCMRSTVDAPGSYVTAPSDWAACTPSAAAWASKASRTANKFRDLEPSDKAVPQMAVHAGKLYLARNTTVGPQLWVCRPDSSGDTAQCDAGDWSHIAANDAGDTELTQFDDPALSTISLLVEAGGALWLGFDDDTRGVVLFHSSSGDPTSRADFQGAGGCTADGYPASCTGMTSGALGTASGPKRFYSAVGLGFDALGYLYLTAGSPTTPVGVWRFTE